MNPPPDYGPVAVLTLIFGYAFAPQIAAVVAPYVLIMVAAVAGSAMRLGQIGATPRGGSFWLVFYSTLIAMCFTVPLAAYSASKLTGISETGLYGFVSFGLGYIGDQWPRVIRFFGGLIKSGLELVVKKGGSE